MRPLRRLMAQLEGPSAAVKGSPGGGGAGAGAAGKTPLQVTQRGKRTPLPLVTLGLRRLTLGCVRVCVPAPPLALTRQLEPVTLEDVAAALEVTKPSARLHEAKYKEFNDEYGQVGC